jgi:sigma-E factor negative regulatory protein RseB
MSSLLMGPVGAVHAQTDPLIDKREAQAWLKKIRTAAQNLNYAGVFIYQQGDQVRSSRITHILDGKNEIEKLEFLDGRPREIIRNNEEITSYIPEAKTLLVERRITQEVFPALLAANSADLAEHYNIRKQEISRVAGFDCQVIQLEPKDRLRFGYKLWAEKNSGLLLRAQTLNEEGLVLEQIAFTQLAIGNIDRSRVKSSFGNTTGWRVENAVTVPMAMTGWTIKGIPPGFRKIRELTRNVSDTGTNGQLTQRDVAQIVFSDGMAAISVFIEPGSQSRTEAWMQQGAMTVIGKRQGEFWLTIVGEIPTSAIRQVTNSIEFKQPK